MWVCSYIERRHPAHSKARSRASFERHYKWHWHKKFLKQGAKRAGKSTLECGMQHIMQGKGRTCKIVCKQKWNQNPSMALSVLLKSINSPKWSRSESFIVLNSGVNMSAALKYISCPVSQLDLLEPIGVQSQVDGYKGIEYLPTSAIQVGLQSHLKLEKVNVIWMLVGL